MPTDRNALKSASDAAITEMNSLYPYRNRFIPAPATPGTATLAQREMSPDEKARMAAALGTDASMISTDPNSHTFSRRVLGDDGRLLTPEEAARQRKSPATQAPGTRLGPMGPPR